MSGALERFDAEARRTFSRYGSTVVRRGYLFRHPVYTRVLHWTVTIFFIASLLTGFAVYSPWLFHWLTPLFGGGPPVVDGVVHSASSEHGQHRSREALRQSHWMRAVSRREIRVALG